LQLLSIVVLLARILRSLSSGIWYRADWYRDVLPLGGTCYLYFVPS